MKQRFPTSKDQAAKAKKAKDREPVALVYDHPDRVPVTVYPPGPHKRKPRGSGTWGDTFSGKQGYDKR